MGRVLQHSLLLLKCVKNVLPKKLFTIKYGIEKQQLQN